MIGAQCSAMSLRGLLGMVFLLGLQAHAEAFRQRSRGFLHSSPGGSVQEQLLKVPPMARFLETVRPNLVNLSYGGGLLLIKEIKVYVIYYGSKFTAHDKEVVRTWVDSFNPELELTETLSLAGWWKIVSEFTQGPNGAHVGKKVSYGGETLTDYSQGKNLNLSTLNFVDIISPTGRPPPPDTVNSTYGFNASGFNPDGPLPYDENGVYLVLSDKDVEVVDETVFCAFHSYMCLDTDLTCKTTLSYAYAPYPAPGTVWHDGCNIATQPEFKNTPNSADGALDSILKVLSHVLAEAVTDPNVMNGYISTLGGEENEDLCLGANYTTDRNVMNGYISTLGGEENEDLCLELCSKKTLVKEKIGILENSLFMDGVGMQTYAPGLDCKGLVDVVNATEHLFSVKVVATVGGLDYLTISSSDGEVTYLAMSGISARDDKQTPIVETNVVRFHSNDSHSPYPYPVATGFQLQYVAVFES